MMMKILKTKKEFIVEEKRDFDSPHASTLIRLKNGDILAAWFGGSWEKNPDVAIWMSRRTAGGWQKPYVIADTWGVALWNPVLFQREDGRIFLFYKEGATIPQWFTKVRISDDEGQTWSEPRELVEGDRSGGRGPVKNKAITLSDGTILAPASVESEVAWDAFVDISRDGGESWTKSPFVPLRRTDYHVIDRPYDKHLCYGKGIIQPTLWESAPGKVHMLLRSTSSAIFRSDSEDGGKTWCCAYACGLPNNNSGLDVVKLGSGELVLAYNPTGNLPGYYKGPRTPLCLALSGDNGESWKNILTLEDAPGGYAYPAIICDNEKKELLVTYTWKRERIVFWRIKCEW